MSNYYYSITEYKVGFVKSGLANCSTHPPALLLPFLVIALDYPFSFHVSS